MIKKEIVCSKQVVTILLLLSLFLSTIMYYGIRTSHSQILNGMPGLPSYPMAYPSAYPSSFNSSSTSMVDSSLWPESIATEELANRINALPLYEYAYVKKCDLLGGFFEYVEVPKDILLLPFKTISSGSIVKAVCQLLDMCEMVYVGRNEMINDRFNIYYSAQRTAPASLGTANFSGAYPTASLGNTSFFNSPGISSFPFNNIETITGYPLISSSFIPYYPYPLILPVTEPGVSIADETTKRSKNSLLPSLYPQIPFPIY